MAFLSKSLISPAERSQDTHKDSYTRNKILAQNRALAKKNSSLMTKISELEAKMSELIQENLSYRDAQAKAEDSKRKWLAEKLSLIEESTLQRFEEMFQMFSNIRANEGLPNSNISLSNLLEFTNTTNSDKTVSFDSIKSPKNHTGVSNRRRKSSRRQSFYVPSEPEQDTDDILFRGNIQSLTHPCQDQDQEETVKSQDTTNEDYEDSSKQEETREIVDSSNDEVNSVEETPIRSDEREIVNLDAKLNSPTKKQKKQDEDIDIMRILDIPGMYQSTKQISDTRIPSLKPVEAPPKIIGKLPILNYDSSSSDVDSQIFHSSTLSPVKISPPPVMKASVPKLQVYKDDLDALKEGLSSTPDITSSPVKQSRPMKKQRKTIKAGIDTQPTPALIAKLTAKPETDMMDAGGEPVPVIDFKEDNTAPKPKQKNSKKRKISNAFDDEKPPSTPIPTSSVRPSRTRGNRVSYVEPRLGTKLRRESAGFIEAVSDNAYCHFNRGKSRDSSPMTTSAPANDKTLDQLELSVYKTSESTSETSKTPTRSSTTTESSSKNTKIDKGEPIDSLVEAQDHKEKKKEKEKRPKSSPVKLPEQTNPPPLQTTRIPLTSLNKNKLSERSIDSKKTLVKNKVPDLSVFDLVDESAVGIPKTYKNDLNVTKKRSSGRRNSSLV